MNPPVAPQFTPIGATPPPISRPTAVKVWLTPGVRLTLVGEISTPTKLVFRRTTVTSEVSTCRFPRTRFWPTTVYVPMAAAENRPSGRIVPPDVLHVTAAPTLSPELVRPCARN